jgi:TolB-like protein
MTIAALPLANLTNQPEAARVVFEQLIVELLRRPDVVLTPPGAVEGALAELRIRDAGAMTLEQTRALGTKLSASVLLMGTVSDYKQEADAGRPLPVVSVNLRGVETTEGRVVWACAHTRTGSDAESIFGIGRVTSLPDLTSTVVREMVSTLPGGEHK